MLLLSYIRQEGQEELTRGEYKFGTNIGRHSEQIFAVNFRRRSDVAAESLTNGSNPAVDATNKF